MAASGVAPAGRGFLGHPAGLGLLFGVEMWERFSYYGMRALLVLYLVDAMHWSDADAANLYGTYTALAYAVQIGGGFLSDRVLGTRRSLLIGGAVIVAGHFVLAYPSLPAFYAGLCLVVVGTGLFKPNVSTMVGQLYAPGDRRGRGWGCGRCGRGPAGAGAAGDLRLRGRVLDGLRPGGELGEPVHRPPRGPAAGRHAAAHQLVPGGAAVRVGRDPR